MNPDPDLVLASQDYRKLERTHLKAGFREGVEQGKEDITRQGFQSGYKAGVEASIRWGRLHGRLSSVEMYLQQQNVPLSEELFILKKKVERWREDVGTKGDGREEVSDMREFCEVVENVKVTDNLKSIEQQLEDIIINKLS